jgi:hypothetical protein
VLALAGELARDGGKELRDLVAEHGWEGEDTAPTVLGIADGFLSFWQRHRALLSVIDLAALDGDQRFREMRTDLLSGVSQALETEVERAVAAVRVPADTQPRAVAPVLTSMLAHVAAHRPGLEEFGVPVDHLRATLARIIGWAAVGAPPVPL